jgi:hypothetical protein
LYCAFVPNSTRSTLDSPFPLLAQTRWLVLTRAIADSAVSGVALGNEKGDEGLR